MSGRGVTWCPLSRPASTNVACLVPWPSGPDHTIVLGNSGLLWMTLAKRWSSAVKGHHGIDLEWSGLIHAMIFMNAQTENMSSG